jgi:hypothetical protein
MQPSRLEPARPWPSTPTLWLRAPAASDAILHIWPGNFLMRMRAYTDCGNAMCAGEVTCMIALSLATSSSSSTFTKPRCRFVIADGKQGEYRISAKILLQQPLITSRAQTEAARAWHVIVQAASSYPEPTRSFGSCVISHTSPDANRILPAKRKIAVSAAVLYQISVVVLVGSTGSRSRRPRCHPATGTQRQQSGCDMPKSPCCSRRAPLPLPCAPVPSLEATFPLSQFPRILDLCAAALPSRPSSLPLLLN